MQVRFNGLWKHPDFLKLWMGETVSLFGSQITLVALPLTAALLFNASSFQMGLLYAAEFLPYLLVTLFAGVWIDRYHKRPLLIFCNLGRAILLALIPLGALFHILRMEYLYIIAFLTGVLAVFFQLAYQAYLPTLIRNEQLTEGNSKLSGSDSLAQIAGPGLGGVLVQAVTAPFALILDVTTFLFSAAVLSFIRTKEKPINPPQTRIPLWQEMKEGLVVTFSNPYLRAIACEAATFNLFSNWVAVIFVLFILRDLHLSPSIYGFIIAVGSIGSLLGAIIVGPLERRLGIGPTLIGTMVIACLVPLFMPLATASIFGIGLLAVVGVVQGFGVVASSIQAVSLRQAITPKKLLGRMTASYRFFTWGVIPIGSMLGGLVGQLINIRTSLFIGAAGMAVACLWVIFSPVPRLHQLPVSTTKEEEKILEHSL